ncbi:MAG: acyltransferase [Pseudomonadota bacterium]
MGPTVPLRRAAADPAARSQARPAAHGVARLHELDGLRGLLALFVVGFHLAGPLAALREAMGVWAPFMLEGWYAVDVFFLMSGFVMMHVYGDSFAGALNWGAWRRFMQARVARLYPVHLAALAVLFVCVLQFMLKSPELAADGGRYSVRALLASLFMLHSPWIDYRSWNYPAWSISAEWHAYLLFPLLVPLVRKLGGATALLWLAFAVLVPLGLYLQHLLPDPYPTNGLVVLLRVLPLFSGGMVLYRLRARGNWMSGPLAVLATLGTLACLCSPVAAPYAVLLTPLLVLAVLEDRLVRGLFRAAPLLWLGKISYSLYMTHALVEIFLMRLASKAVQRSADPALLEQVGPAMLLWLASLGAALLLGWLTWRAIEGPGRVLLVRWLPK